MSGAATSSTRARTRLHPGGGARDRRAHSTGSHDVAARGRAETPDRRRSDLDAAFDDEDDDLDIPEFLR